MASTDLLKTLLCQFVCERYTGLFIKICDGDICAAVWSVLDDSVACSKLPYPASASAVAHPPPIPRAPPVMSTDLPLTTAVLKSSEKSIRGVLATATGILMDIVA
jgi:hypothetical protein